VRGQSPVAVVAFCSDTLPSGQTESLPVIDSPSQDEHVRGRFRPVYGARSGCAVRGGEACAPSYWVKKEPEPDTGIERYEKQF
jgi:hypothetical protein